MGGAIASVVIWPCSICRLMYAQSKIKIVKEITIYQQAREGMRPEPQGLLLILCLITVVVGLVLVGGTPSPSAVSPISLMLTLRGPVAIPVASPASVFPGASPCS